MHRSTVVPAVEAAFRTEWSPLMATLVRELRDLELAEDVVQEAFVEAARRWRLESVPARPGAWLLTTARRKAIDRIRRDQRFTDRLPALVERQASAAESGAASTALDDQLGLLFGCCHPALAIEAQVALTLRSVAGLSTRQIARAFLVPEDTMAKRLSRAKQKVREAGIPFTVPPRNEVEERIAAVCAVVYAIYTEGHRSSTGSTLIRGDLCDEAVWLAETLTTLASDESEVAALAALCLLTDARRNARVDHNGVHVLLADQDRQQWDRSKIQRGLHHLARAHDGTAGGPYRLQATIAALHSTAPSYAETDWNAVVSMYDLMIARGGGAVAALNRAVALGEAAGLQAALDALDELADAPHESLEHYAPFHIARAHMLDALGHQAQAVAAWQTARITSENEQERAWLEQRVRTARNAGVLE